MTRLQPGDPAPPFTLPDQDGATVSLSDFAGRKVIVFVYPAAMTPGCTTQACDFRDALTPLRDAGYAVVDPIVYEDFLPVSAAGIFQSNLGGGEQRAYDAHANQDAFEAALGKTIHDPFALYQQAQDASIAALRA